MKRLESLTFCGYTYYIIKILLKISLFECKTPKVMGLQVNH